MKHIMEFDKSESIIPHGEVSKKLYGDILSGRMFDLYGGKYHREVMNDHEEQEIALVARRMGIDYTTVATAKAEVGRKELRFIDVYGKRGVDDLKRPVITTPYFRIGTKEHYNPPVGFSKAPSGSLNSEGNEQYYAYDGTWINGKMHGFGYYLYDDGGSFDGEFKNNWPDGEGKTRYVYRPPKPRKMRPESAENNDSFPLPLTLEGEQKEDVGRIVLQDISTVTPSVQIPVMAEAKEDMVPSSSVALTAEQSSEVAPTLNGEGDYVEGGVDNTEEVEEKKHRHHEHEHNDEPGQPPAVETHKYVGQWKNGRFHGYGKQYSSMGHEYSGEFSRTKRQVTIILFRCLLLDICDELLSIQGHGKITFSSGLEYEGPFVGIYLIP